MRKIGLSLSAPPGALPSRMSLRRTARASGTNTLSVTMVLLPVPRMPVVCQVSRTEYSPGGTMSSSQSGGPAPCSKPPTITQEL